MKKPGPLFLLLAAVALILAACSASSDSELNNNTSGQAANGNPSSNEGRNDPSEGEVQSNEGRNDPSESGAQEEESTVTDSFSPTPSPLFEQDYGPNEVSDRDYSDLQIITLLPQDGIPAITFPQYYPVEQANEEYDPDELVIGVEFNGEARAYSVPLLSRHEIVNETVGGIHLAVTW